MHSRGSGVGYTGAVHHVVRIAVLGGILAASLLPSSAALAWERATSESGAPLFWSARRIVLRPAADPELLRIVDDASRSWSSVGPCTDLSLSNGGIAPATTTNLDGGPYDGENRVVMRRAAWPAELGSMTLAITTTAYITRTGELLDADVDVNGVDAVWSTEPRPSAGQEDLANTVTHELGHALGLAHSSDGSATMFARSAPGEIVKRDLAADDQDAICTIYPAGSTTPTEPRSRVLGCGCRAGAANASVSITVVSITLVALSSLALGYRRRRPITRSR